MYGQDDQNGTGDWFADNAPPAPDPWTDPNNQIPADPNGPNYHTVPGWMNPNTAPLPTHPYYADWLAANPGYVPPAPPPGGGGGGGGTGGGGTGGGGGGGWPVPPTYTSDPNAPIDTPPAPYAPPEWTGGDYVNPTEADLLASPGYQTRLDAGFQARERSAAARGTVLNGGTLKALERYGQDYAQNEYQQLRANTYENYKTRYGQFQDKAGMDFAARTANANDAQTSYQNRATRYLAGNNRTLSDYITNLNARRNAETDYWNRNRDLSDAGRR